MVRDWENMVGSSLSFRAGIGQPTLSSPASPLGDFPTNKYSRACGRPCAVVHLISCTQTGPEMNSRTYNALWELIAEKAARESDPSKAPETD